MNQLLLLSTHSSNVMHFQAKLTDFKYILGQGSPKQLTSACFF